MLATKFTYKCFILIESTVLSFLSSKPRSAAPHTPRIALLGPTGSGKGVQAALLANKYNIVNGAYKIYVYLSL